MRLKIVVPVLLVSLAGLVAIFFAHSLPDKTTASVATGDTSSPLPAPEKVAAVRDFNLRATIVSSLAEPVIDEETHEDYVARRVAELMDLAMSDDRSSLASILSELNNSDPQIRDAAVSASVQFKSSDAIPALQEVYNHTDDPQEKIHITSAIQFLSIPVESGIIGQTN